MEDGPLISVVIPCYNRARLIPRALASVKAQNFDDIEIVLVDDGSSDDTVAAVRKLINDDPRIHLVVHERNRGEAAARNTGVRSARGKYVAFLDSDDEWLPNKLASQISVITTEPDTVAAVACGYFLIDEDGTKSAIRDWSDDSPITCLNLLTKGCSLSMGTTLMVRRNSFSTVGYFDEGLPLLVDIDWLCRLTRKYQIRKISEPFALYYKAPMRRGEPMAEAVLKFEKNNAALIRSFGLSSRLRIRSCFYGYISLGYAANGPWAKFIITRLLHFLFNPFQRPGNYVHFLLALTGIAPIGKRI